MTFNNKISEQSEAVQHCCELMRAYVDNTHGMILYRPYFREYAVKVGGNTLQQIQYCPWCGSNLPEDLSERFFHTVKTEVGKDVNLSEIKNLPLEFQTDEWWKKRGF